MSDPNDVQQFLNGLLMTDPATLHHLYTAVFSNNAVPPPEQIVIELTNHVKEHQEQIPANLMRWLRSPSSIATHVLAQLIRLGGFYRDPDIAPPLMGILRQLTYVAAHPMAVRALAQSKGGGASRVLSDLLWSAPIGQWHVREPAILREMGHLGHPSSIDELVKALAVPYDSMRRAAAEALARFGEDALPYLLPLVRSSDSAYKTAGAAEALGLIGDARAVPPLQHAAQRPEPSIAIHATVALARLRSPDAETRLHALARHGESAVRSKAMHALAIAGEHGEEGPSQSTYGVLLSGLRDSQPEVRAAAAYALGHLRHVASANAIGQSLIDEVSPLVQSDMIRALGLLARTESLPVLLQSLRSGTTTTNVKAEVLNALSLFTDPDIAKHIVPFRTAGDPKLVQAANRALRRLLHKPFSWPGAAAIESDTSITIDLFDLAGARERFLPPPPPPTPSFFDRLFGSKPPKAPTPPQPIGRMVLTPERLTLELNAGAQQHGWADGSIDWSRRFSVQITREPVSEAGSQSEGPNDIGIHFALRQREGDVGANFHIASVSLWCARSEVVGQFPVKSSQLPCIDPHASAPFLAALQWYTEVHGNPIRVRKGLSYSEP